jgi:hypothetical protein
LAFTTNVRQNGEWPAFIAGDIQMRDTQKKVLEWIEVIVTAYDSKEMSLELLVNYRCENAGHLYVQPTDCFSNVIDCAFMFESRFAAFDFGSVEFQIDYAKPETVLRVLDRFRSAVASHIKRQKRHPSEDPDADALSRVRVLTI